MPKSPSARRGFQKPFGHPAGPSGFLKSPQGFGGFRHWFPQKNPNFLYKFGGFRKNWDFHTFRLAWFLKGFQAKKRLVLHVLCPSHPCASLARTVLKPLSFAQAIHALVLHVLSLSLPTLSTSYPAGCEVKVKWVKWSEVNTFLVLKFFQKCLVLHVLWQSL